MDSHKNHNKVCLIRDKQLLKDIVEARKKGDRILIVKTYFRQRYS